MGLIKLFEQEIFHIKAVLEIIFTVIAFWCSIIFLKNSYLTHLIETHEACIGKWQANKEDLEIKVTHTRIRLSRDVKFELP